MLQMDLSIIGSGGDGQGKVPIQFQHKGASTGGILTPRNGKPNNVIDHPQWPIGVLWLSCPTGENAQNESSWVQWNNCKPGESPPVGQLFCSYPMPEWDHQNLVLDAEVGHYRQTQLESDADASFGLNAYVVGPRILNVRIPGNGDPGCTLLYNLLSPVPVTFNLQAFAIVEVNLRYLDNGQQQNAFDEFLQ